MPPKPQKRILVVEDEPAWQRLIKDLIREVGSKIGCTIEVVTTVRFAGALTAIEEAPYDCVTADNKLLDGKRAKALLDCIGRLDHQTPVIVISGAVDPSDVRDFFKDYDIEEFFWKDDFDSGQFKDTLKRLLASGEGRSFQPDLAPFHDFELLIADRQQQSYPVRVIESPAGQAEGLFEMPWKQDDLERTLVEMEEWKTSGRSLVDFGTRLFNALFTDDVRARFAESVGRVARDDAGLRIRLRFDPPELQELPWELLYDPEKREFLVLSKRALVTRYLHVPRPTPPLEVKPPLRLLVVTATPTDWNPLSVKQEVQGIREALQPLVNEELVHLLVAEHITRYSLRQHLLDDAPHILHYIGHGDFDGKQGMLILEDSNGSSDPLEGQILAMLLNGTHVRLAVLNCCLGAKDATADASQFGRKRAALLGVGPALIDAGLGAVVAMQFSADDRAAVVFAQDFYQMIARFRPIDEAVGRAREMVMLHSGAGNRNWATPVLFMRAQDGRLFELTRAEKTES